MTPAIEKKYLKQRSREDVIALLTATPAQLSIWQKLPDEYKEELIAVYCRQTILKITYDRVFKYVFNPEIHPDRLERLLSQILKQPVKVLRALPLEKNNVHLKSKRIYMDMLVELEDLSLANIEMQIIGWRFPNTRSAIYSASLLMQQYNSLVAKYLDATGESGSKACDDVIDYSKIHKVYTIVLMEESTPEFHDFPNDFIHHSHQVFTTGLQFDMLQEYIYIPLDIFKDIVSEPSNDLEAWLAFLTAETIAEIDFIVAKFPYFKNLLDDVILYTESNPKEVLGMVLENLEYLDLFDMKAAKDEMADNRRILAEQKALLAAQEAALADQEAELADQKAALADQKAALADQKAALAARDDEIARLKALLSDKQ